MFDAENLFKILENMNNKIKIALFKFGLFYFHVMKTSMSLA